MLLDEPSGVPKAADSPTPSVSISELPFLFQNQVGDRHYRNSLLAVEIGFTHTESPRHFAHFPFFEEAKLQYVVQCPLGAHHFTFALRFEGADLILEKLSQSVDWRLLSVLNTILHDSQRHHIALRDSRSAPKVSQGGADLLKEFVSIRQVIDALGKRI